jgi:4-amino-4-deoxy-L-arabinose transferase-like glycosyltransferase
LVNDKNFADLHSFRLQWILLTVLGTFYFFSRLIYLDADLPPWEIANYDSIDEFYYTASAFEMVEGLGTHNRLLTSSLGWAFNSVQQLLTATTLAVFGDNYYGLRLPSVVAGFIVLASFFIICFDRFGPAPAFAFAALLLSEFSFTLASRTVEPTIFRMAGAALVLLHFCKLSVQESARQHVQTGLLVGAAWFLLYPTNAFLGLFGALSVLFLSETRRLAGLAYYLLGIAISFVVYAACCIYLPDQNLSTFIHQFQPLQPRLAGTGASSLWLDVYEKLRETRSANFLQMYQEMEYILVASVTVIFLSLVVGWRPRRADILLFLFLICFLLQTCFVNDYPKRKLVFLYPVALYAIVLAAALLFRAVPRRARSIAGMTLVLTSVSALATPTIWHIYANPQFEQKMAMQSLKDIGNARLIGGWSFAFRLYNTYHPFLNKYAWIYRDAGQYYAWLHEAGERKEAEYTIEYGTMDIEAKLNEIGFFRKELILPSNDATRPNVYLYSFRGS